MAITERLITSVLQTARSKTSGYQDESEVNNNLAMVENELMETLLPLYETNQKVRDLLNPFITPPATTDIIEGVVDLPDDYLQYLDGFIDGKPVYKRNVNEVSIINTSPTRRPKSNGPFYVFFAGNGINVLPKEKSKIDIIYVRKPIPGSIEFEVVSNDERDYVEIKVERETEWTERAFNFLYYMMLEKYGIEQQANLAYEYSQLGINKEIAKS